MKKVLLLALMALVSSGCAVRMSNGTKVLFWQRGIVLTVDHQCTNHAVVYQGSAVVGEIRGAAPEEIPLMPRVYGDDSIQITLKSLNNSGGVSHSTTHSFPIDRRSTESWTWIVSNKTGGWGRNVVSSRCQ